MSNHFAAVGFKLEGNDDVPFLVEQTAEKGAQIDFSGGTLFRWVANVDENAGEEIVLLLDNKRNLRGLAPHFTGSTRVEVAITSAFPDAEGFWEGGFYAWMNPPTDNLESGDYPFVFDVGDFWIVNKKLRLPQVVEVQIAAFAHEIKFFDSEVEYSNSQEGETQFAPNFFIPSGLFVGEGGGAPQPYALFAGTILQHRQRTNATTSQTFHHFEVETLGGVFDVVAENELVAQSEQTPCIGGILSGEFWMSGRVLDLENQPIIEEPPAKKKRFGLF